MACSLLTISACKRRQLSAQPQGCQPLQPPSGVAEHPGDTGCPCTAEPSPPCANPPCRDFLSCCQGRAAARAAGPPPSCQVLPDAQEGTRLPNACGAGPSRAPRSAPRIQLAALSPSPARLRGLPQAGRESRQRWHGATSILLPLPEHRARCQRGAGGAQNSHSDAGPPLPPPTPSPGDPTGTTGTPVRASAAPVPAGSSRAMQRAWGTFPSQGSLQLPHGKEPFLGKGPKPPARPPGYISQGKSDPPPPSPQTQPGSRQQRDWLL